MTILLSGATGFLGSYLLKSFMKNGYNIVVLKRSTSDVFRIKDCLDKVYYYNIDKINLSEIFQNHIIDVVINTVTNYGRKDSNLSSVLDTNLLFGLRLLEEASSANVKAFLNTDTLLERNINAYALSKAQFVDWMKFLSCQNTKMINIKIEHMYGSLDDENKFIYWFIHQLKQNVEKIDLTSGAQKRDFIYIDDIVNAYEIILKNMNILKNFEEFELGTGKSIEVKRFVDQIVKEFRRKRDISTKLNFGAIPYRENENMNMHADITKLEKLGWQPKVAMKDGIKRILQDIG